jgi:hypothetical protein
LIDHRSVLLAAYDEQLRGVAEMQGAQSWDRDGPLYRTLFERRGFVSYESLAGVEDLDDLIERTVAYFAGISQVEEFEWKSRGHDHPADLDTRLQRAGLVPEEVETVVVGEAAELAVEVEVPLRLSYGGSIGCRSGRRSSLQRRPCNATSSEEGLRPRRSSPAWTAWETMSSSGLPRPSTRSCAQADFLG